MLTNQINPIIPTKGLTPLSFQTPLYDYKSELMLSLLTDKDKFETEYKKLKLENKRLCKIANKILKRADSDLDSTVNNLYKKSRLTIYQVKWFLISLINESGKKSGNRFNNYINVIDGQTGSGKSWLQLFIMTHTNLLYGSKNSYCLNFTSPFQVDDVLKSNTVEFLKKYEAEEREIMKQIKDKDFMLIVHSNIYKSLSPDNKLIMDRLVLLKKCFVYNNQSLKQIEQVKTLFIEKNKIITVQSSLYLDSVILPILQSIDRDFDVKSNIFDEAHREGHTFYDILISMNTTMQRNQYGKRTESVYDRFDDLGFVSTFFTGTSSWQQRFGDLNGKVAASLIAEEKIKFSDDEDDVYVDGVLQKKLTKEQHQQNFIDDCENGVYDRFKFHAMSKAEQNLVSVKNAPLGTITNLTDVMETVANENGTTMSLLVGSKFKLNYSDRFVSSLCELNKPQDDIRLKWIRFDNKLRGTTAHKYIDNNYTNFTLSGLNAANAKNVSYGIDKDAAVDIMQHTKFFGLDAKGKQRRIDWGSLAIKSLDFVVDPITYKSSYTNIVYQDYFNVALSRTMQERCFDRNGMSFVKLDKKNSIYGMGFKSYTQFIDNNFADQKDNILYWTSKDMRIASSSDREQFKGMQIHDVLEAYPNIKQVVILKKLEVGVSINHINAVFILKRERSVNGEFMSLEQLIGRGVRNNGDEPLDLIFFNIGDQEKAAIKRLVDERQTVLPIKEHALVSEMIKSFEEEGGYNLITPKVVEIIKAQFKIYYDTAMKEDIEDLIALSYKKLIRASGENYTEEEFHSAMGMIAKTISYDCETHMHKYIVDAVKQGGQNISDIKISDGESFFDIDFKFNGLDNYVPSKNWSLKGADRTDGKLHLGVLFLPVKLFVNPDRTFSLDAWIMEFNDDSVKNISESTIIKSENAFRLI